MGRGSRLPAFTFPEALTTIALMVIFASLGGVLFFQGNLLVNKLESRERFIQDKASMALYLPELCLSITPPGWVDPSGAYRQEGKRLILQYWEGDPRISLVLEGSEEGLTVTSPRGTWWWRALGPVELEFWKEDGRIVGLVVKWTESGASKNLTLPWGAVPL